MSSPLADKIRPQSLGEMVGQQHILGEKGLLRRIAEGGNIPNMIFYGPSGVGKTTAARIIASAAGKRLYKLNGTTASTGDIKALIGELDSFAGLGGVVLYLDEIQYLNKKQQQTLLEFIEDGSITLIASTTENPYFYIYNAILSRCTVFEFKPVEAAEVEQALRRVTALLGEDTPVELEDGVLGHIASCCGGDVRKAMNALELCWLAAAASEGDKRITLDDAKTVAQRSAMRYDRDGDQHYDLLSALQKSIRGSDENAAIHYLARLLEAGDLLSPCRRLLVIAAEDIGMAYPQAMPVVKACVDAAIQLGLPEARIPLAEAAVFLATAPKSNSSYLAMDGAIADIQAGRGTGFPRCLQNKHADGAEVAEKGQFYRYPHDFPNHYTPQQYLPDDLVGRVYYHYGENKVEQAGKAYWDKIKK
ncbi:MAG: replication-associated recombination protein A [Angelakisella sp.]